MVVLMRKEGKEEGKGKSEINWGEKEFYDRS